jgi:hypothetical protein
MLLDGWQSILTPMISTVSLCRQQPAEKPEGAMLGDPSSIAEIRRCPRSSRIHGRRGVVTYWTLRGRE